MKAVIETTSFKKDSKHYKNDAVVRERLATAISCLIQETAIPGEFRDHSLVGNLAGCRECHLRPNALLVYRDEGDVIRLLRLCNHSELFDS